MRERAAPIERLVAFFARVALFHQDDAVPARVDAREQVGDQIVGLLVAVEPVRDAATLLGHGRREFGGGGKSSSARARLRARAGEAEAQLAEAQAQLAAIQTQRASRKRRKRPASPSPDWLLVEEVRGLLILCNCSADRIVT